MRSSHPGKTLRMATRRPERDGRDANLRSAVPAAQDRINYMDDGRFFSEDFIPAVVSAGARARIETLQAGVPREKNYQVVRELDETAA